MQKFLMKFPVGVASAIVVIAILYLTLFPHPLPDNDIQWFAGMDKVVHGIMMFGLSICLAYDFMRSDYGLLDEKPPKNVLLAILLITIVFGGIIELLQDCMDLGRSLDVIDFLADSIGGVVAFIVELLCWSRVRKWLVRY